jgi:uncharacterized membrane protein YccC
MPAMFAVGDKLVDDPTVATFAAFGSFALVLLVEFGGPMRERLEAQLGLSIVTGGLLCLATLVSRSPWVAAAVTVAVAFGVLFAGVVSSVLAGATTSLLLAFILPVSLAGSPSSIPARVEGWGLACGAALLAMMLLWPAPAQDPLRRAAADACESLARRLRADVEFRLARGVDGTAAQHDAATAEARQAVAALYDAFLATPYRPTGLSTSARTTIRLIDELSWMTLIFEQSVALGSPVSSDSSVVAVKRAAATVLDRGAAVLRQSGGSAESLHEALSALRGAMQVMEADATVELPVARRRSDQNPRPDEDVDDARIQEFVTSLDPSFRAQELSFAVGLIGLNIERTAVAEGRSWWQRVLGHQPEGVAGPLTAAQERAGAHLERHSVWLHNSLRGALALGLAVLIADKSGVQHSFWVVFGTLSVLRSNALNTGQNAIRGVLGTVVGFAIGAVLLEVIGTNTTMLWALLPIVVLFAGIAPALISFAAGQATFTVTLVILYNIVQPAGWQLGLVRIEDVAIGCAVSLGVGVLLWPRGAGAALRTALAEAYNDSAHYLDSAVTYGALRCDGAHATSKLPAAEATLAAAASRRLDDTFRNYLAERGPKPVSLAEMTSLINGVAALRLAANAVVDLWQSDNEPSGDRAAARAELLASSALVRDWYDDLAVSLLDGRDLQPPLGHDKVADGRLINAVRQDLQTEDGASTAAAVRVIWTADHLDAARRLQQTIIGPARATSGH